jgi:hypothetical protein
MKTFTCSQKPNWKLLIQSVVLLGCFFLTLAPKAFADNAAFADTAGTYKAASTYYSAYGQSRTWSINVNPGSHTFEVDGIAQYMKTEWYVNGSYTGITQDSGFWAVDPDYTRSFSSGTTKVEALVYYSNFTLKTRV